MFPVTEMAVYLSHNHCDSGPGMLPAEESRHVSIK